MKLTKSMSRAARVDSGVNGSRYAREKNRNEDSRLSFTDVASRTRRPEQSVHQKLAMVGRVTRLAKAPTRNSHKTLTNDWASSENLCRGQLSRDLLQVQLQSIGTLQRNICTLKSLTR